MNDKLTALGTLEIILQKSDGSLNQRDLLQRMFGAGFPVSQATISRMLRDLGAVRDLRTKGYRLINRG